MIWHLIFSKKTAIFFDILYLAIYKIKTNYKIKLKFKNLHKINRYYHYFLIVSFIIFVRYRYRESWEIDVEASPVILPSHKILRVS